MHLKLPLVERFLNLPSGRVPRARRRVWLAIALSLVGVASAFVLVGTISRRSPPDGLLVATSAPPGVQIDVDGRHAGQTPLTIPVGSGQQLVAVHDPRYVDVSALIRVEKGETASARFDPWLRTPAVQALHPSFPGAAIDRVAFLSDGRVAIGETLPPGTEHQAWLLGANGAMRHVGPPYAHGPVALAPNGKRVAFLDRDPSSSPGSPGDTGPNEVFAGSLDGQRADLLYRFSPGQGQPVDLTWAPDAAHVLVVARQPISGSGARSHFLWVPLDGNAPKDLASIPSEVVPDSYTWSPDGRSVAFLTSTGSLTSLCLLDTSTGTFTYLADLGRDDSSPLPFPPLAWSPDGEQLIYAAPSSDPSGPTGWLFGGKPPIALFQASVSHPFGDRIGKAEGQAPAWRNDGSVLALIPDRGGSLRVRQVGSNGSTEDVGTIPVTIQGAFAVRWDVAHGQGLLVAQGAASQIGTERQFWLVQFRPGVAG